MSNHTLKKVFVAGILGHAVLLIDSRKIPSFSEAPHAFPRSATTQVEMTMSLPPISSLAGVWRREVNYEPLGTVADDATRDQSTVLWIQSPTGLYVDARHVRSEGYRARGFAGKLTVSSQEDTFCLTWARRVDTQPESCPEGVDSAKCRVCGPLENVEGTVLLEEGPGYLEVWRRVAVWNEETFSIHASQVDGNGDFTQFSAHAGSVATISDSQNRPTISAVVGDNACPIKFSSLESS